MLSIERFIDNLYYFRYLSCFDFNWLRINSEGRVRVRQQFSGGVRVYLAPMYTFQMEALRMQAYMKYVAKNFHYRHLKTQNEAREMVSLIYHCTKMHGFEDHFDFILQDCISSMPLCTLSDSYYYYDIYWFPTLQRAQYLDLEDAMQFFLSTKNQRDWGYDPLEDDESILLHDLMNILDDIDTSVNSFYSEDSDSVNTLDSEDDLLGWEE
jgi:hypothetical protein